MQIRSEERLSFYRRLALSATLFLLLLSLGGNAFLVMTRPPEALERSVSSAPLKDRLLLEPGAFGEVQRGFTVRTQEKTGTTAILPVGSYILPDGLLQTLPTLQYLYRDQGIQIDEAHVTSLLETMNLQIPWQSMGLFPSQEKWRSADRSLEFVLDAERRALTISVLGSFSPAPEGRADDNTTIEIAKMFVQKVGMDLSRFGYPRVTEKILENGSSRTYVVWSMAFGGAPLVDTMGQPVYGAQVQVGRLSRRALSATFTLLTDEALPKSAYPSASKDALKKGLEQGGLLPAPKATGKNPPAATFTGMQMVYILYPSDREHPTYLVPGLYVAWKQPAACSDCAETQIATILPSIDPSQYQWYAGVPMKPKPLVPVVGTGSTTATGSLKN